MILYLLFMIENEQFLSKKVLFLSENMLFMVLYLLFMIEKSFFFFENFLLVKNKLILKFKFCNKINKTAFIYCFNQL